MNDLRERIRKVMQESGSSTAWPRLALADELKADPRAISQQLQALKREGVVETYLDDWDNRPIWLWTGPDEDTISF